MRPKRFTQVAVANMGLLSHALAQAGGMSQAVGVHGHAGGAGSPPVQGNPNIGHPAHVNVKKPSDQRFRSFAERYMIARAHLFRVGLSDHTEDQWECIMDAKRAYAMINRVGQNIDPEDGVF